MFDRVCVLDKDKLEREKHLLKGKSKQTNIPLVLPLYFTKTAMCHSQSQFLALIRPLPIHPFTEQNKPLL